LWPNGKAYIGAWEKGKQHGVGIYSDGLKDVKKKGEWVAGKRVRWIDE
jgi:MORN repeat